MVDGDVRRETRDELSRDHCGERFAIDLAGTRRVSCLTSHSLVSRLTSHVKNNPRRHLGGGMVGRAVLGEPPAPLGQRAARPAASSDLRVA